MQQQQQEMIIQVRQSLVEGEELIWSGAANQKRQATIAPNLPFLIMTIVFGFIGILFLLVAIILINSRNDINAIKNAISLFIIGGFFFFVALIFGLVSAIYRFAPRNTVYAITSHRALIIRTGRFTYVDSFGRNDIGQIRRIERSDGSGDLLFNRPAMAYPYGSTYSNTGSSYSNSSLMYNGSAGFIGLEDVKSVEKILISTFKH